MWFWAGCLLAVPSRGRKWRHRACHLCRRRKNSGGDWLGFASEGRNHNAQSGTSPHCFVCTVVPLSMLQPLGLYLILLLALLFTVSAMVTRLVLPSDLRLVMDMARYKVLAPRCAPDV